jgi:hypothetical protein
MAFLQAEVAWSTVALTATTAKSVGGLKAATNQVVKILEISCSHDGSTSSNAPDVTDIGRCTFATNGPGTNSTSYTPGKKDPGRAETVQTTAAVNWTTEPTVITVFRTVNLAQYNGLYHYITPFANPMIVIGGQGLVVRQNSPNNVNACGTIEFEE